MENWIDELARALDGEQLTSAETAHLLDAARDVAHRVERKMAPVSTFMVAAQSDASSRAGQTARRPLARC